MIKQIIISCLGADGSGRMDFSYYFVHHKERSRDHFDFELKKQITVDDKTVDLDISDCIIMVHSPSACVLNIKHANGFCIFFSLTSRASFDEVDELILQVHRVRDVTDVTMVLIATKSDQVDEYEVTIEEGAELAKKHEIPFFVGSAKTGQGVEKPFIELTRMSIEYYARLKEEKDRKEKCELM